MDFNIEEYLIKEAAKLDAPIGDVAPLDWDQIPGNTPEEKKTALLEMCASILRGSPNILADAYGGVQSTPMQGGYGSPNYMIPVYELYQAVMGYKGSLGGKERKQFENLFGGNEQSIVSKALEEHGHEFDASSAYLFGGKIKDRTKIEDVKGRPADKYQALMMSYRQHLVATLQKEILALGDEMASSHGVTKPEYCHLLRVKNNKGQLRYIGYGNPGDFIQKVGGIEVANDLARQAHIALTSRKSEMHKLMLAPLFSGVKATEEEMKLNPKAAPISDEEILGPIGLLPSNYPNSPQMEFVVESIPYERISNKDLTPEQVTQKREAWARNRIVNIDLLRKYLIAGGYDNGDGLAELVGTSRMSALKEDVLDEEELEAIEEGGGIADSRYAAQVVYYYYSRLCNNNPKIFCEMLERAGFGYLKEATRAKVYKDETFEAYNLNFRSKAEADVVTRLRSSFGLMATPIPLSMPSPPECPTNPESFVIDFTIPCDIIEEWVPDEEGLLHPEIHPKVIFVGEYFGFDFSKEIQIPTGQIWTTPDGNVATCLDNDGNSVEMTSGNTITYGQRYKLASEWKRMGETFVAHATGNSVIHIAKDSNNEEIGAELDRSNIIYAPLTVNGAANQQLLWHASQCRKQDCAVHRYVSGGVVTPKKYSVAEAYISSCFTDLDIRYAYMPAIAIVNQEFGRGAMYNYYKTQQELDQKKSKAWQNYVEIEKAKGDVHSAMFAYVEICKEAQKSRAEFMKVLRDRMDEQKSLPEYQYRLNGLRGLLSQVQSGASYNDAQISQECSRYLSPYTPIPRN